MRKYTDSDHVAWSGDVVVVEGESDVKRRTPNPMFNPNSTFNTTTSGDLEAHIENIPGPDDNDAVDNVAGVERPFTTDEGYGAERAYLAKSVRPKKGAFNRE